MSRVDKYLASAAAEETRQHILDACGNEVFFVGRVNADKVVEGVEVYARGNEFSAPALLQVAQQGDVVLHNHPSGALLPSGADTQVASLLGNDGIGFYIVNNDVSDIYVMVEPFAERTVVPVNTEMLADVLGETGPIAAKLENYEFRPQQITMMEVVSRSINDNLLAVVEAGTGTGKTLAYLLPAITYAVNNQERIVVSTNTINLQEQIVNKDLPFLQSVLKKTFKAVLVKGRTNYACKRKLEEADIDPDLFSEDDEKSELREILDWARSTRDGSKSDLNFIPKPAVWEKVQSESDTSLKTRCPFYSTCFFYTARRKAAVADVLVANHHLLFSDLAVRAALGASENAILPTYDRIILDEAHNVEEVATNYFGTRVTYFGLLRILGRLYCKKGNSEKGLLIYLSNKLNRLARGFPHEGFIKTQSALQEQGVIGVEKLDELLRATMDSIYAAVQAQNSRDSEYGEIKLRMTPAILKALDWQENVTKPAGKLVQEIRKFTGKCSELLRKVDKLQTRLQPDLLSLTIDVRAQLARLDQGATDIEQVLLENEASHVRWVEIKKGYNNTIIVRLQCSPLDVAPILKETIFDKFKNVVMTSATLTVEGKFDFIRRRLGLDQVNRDRLLELQLSAPFDYEKQTLVAAPQDVPEPNDSRFADVITDLILESIRITRGRAFVLFTSYGLLNKVFFSVKNQIEALGHNVYKQGNENRHHLLQRFREDTSSVLFATDSFWEGVDVHGESLESVIITKLPFRVPSEPIVEARLEAIERRGGNAFLEYMVPHAAIKFKQGFGRLIRRKTDRGSVLILDRRIIQKYYGRVFLKSLPKCRVVAGPIQQVLSELEAFHAKQPLK
ncbi:DEAD/DEAH box helicase [candidate division KSB1 bacterium]|nr:DEAD/DEAH box helicase [candidate division KSB1 bacterium]